MALSRTTLAVLITGMAASGVHSSTVEVEVTGGATTLGARQSDGVASAATGSPDLSGPLLFHKPRGMEGAIGKSVEPYDVWAAETSAALEPHFARLEASGLSFDLELDNFLAQLPAPEPAVSGGRRMQEIDDLRHELLLRSHLPDTVGAPTARCEDELATNLGALGECSYSCITLQQAFFPGEDSRCFQYEAGAWPAELMEMRRERLDDYTYANAALYEDGRPVRFTVGESGGCTNVTITTLHEEVDPATPAYSTTEIRCLVHGEHEHSHSAAHTIEVDGASSPVHSEGGTTAFVVGECTDVLVRIVTQTSAQVHALAWRVTRTNTNDSWEFEASATTEVSTFEFYSCFFDGDYTVERVDDSTSWTGTVAVVGYINYQNTIVVPNDERWILQGALDDDGVPVQLDARISSGGPVALTNASIVMRHIRFTERIGPLDLDVETRGFSTRPEAKLGGAFFYEGGFGAKLLFHHLVFDRCGDMSHSGGAIHISGRGEDTPRGQFHEAGLHWEIRNSLFFRNVAGLVAGFRTVNIWPLQFVMEDTDFVDNAAVVAHWCHQWYPDMNDALGHKAAASDIVLTRTKTMHKNYEGSPRSLEILNAMVFTFPGTTSVEDAPRNTLTVQDLEFSGHVSLFHAGMIHQTMEDGDGVWDVSIDGGNYSHNTGYGDVNLYTVGALLLMSHSNTGNNFLISRTNFDYNIVDPSTYMSQNAQGGGVIANIAGVARFEESRWTGNVAASGGGMRVLGPGSVEIVRCHFTENTALSLGGAISSGIANMLVRDSTFIGNRVVPPSSASLVTVFVRVHHDLDTRNSPIWKVDGIAPLTTCPPGLFDGTQDPITGAQLCTLGQVTGFVPANETIYGNPRTTNCTGGGDDDLCLSRTSDYTEVLRLTPGRHRLWHGSELNTTMPTLDWAGHGWIDIVDVLPKVYVAFADNRATADENGYIRKPGCTSTNEDAGYEQANVCPYGQKFWSFSDFDVPFGTGGAIAASGGGGITILRTTFANNRAGEGAAFSSVGDDIIHSIDTDFGELQEGDLSLVTISGRFADCEEPAPCNPGHECIFAQDSRSCTDCGSNEKSADGRTCDKCPPGTQPDVTRSRCEECGPGEHSIDGSCTACAPGKAPNADQVTCTDCPLGTVGLIGICTACGPGEQANEQHTACVSCLTGKAGVGTCDFCEAGKQPASSLAICENCAAGKAGVAGVCEFCAPGKQPRNDSIACDACPPGMASLGLHCEPCGDGEMPTDTGAACMECPDGTAGVGGFCEQCDAREEANFDRTSCQCKGNKFNVDTFGPIWCDDRTVAVGDDTCVDCPVCLECGEADVRLQVGWAFYGQGRAYSCPVPAGCNGPAHNRTLELFDQSKATWAKHRTHTYPFADAAIDSQCARGYTGPTCGECLTNQANSAGNYHHLRVGKPCVLCGEGTVNLPKLGLLILVAVAAAITVASGIINVISDHGMLTDARLLVGFWQQLGQMQKVLNISLPEPVPSLVEMLRLMLFDVKQILNLDCLDIGGFFGQLITNVLILPIIGLLICILRYKLSQKTIAAVVAAGGASDSAYDAVLVEFQQNLALVTFLLYPTVTSTLFRVQMCTPVGKQDDGEPYVYHQDDYTIDCNASEYAIGQGLALIGILVVPIGVPAYFYIQMRRQEQSIGGVKQTALGGAKLAPEDVEDEDDRFGFLCRDMRPSYYYWEIVIYVRKLLLSGISTVVGRGTMAQSYFVCVISSFFLMSHMRAYPYTVEKHNIIDALGHLALILTYISTFIVRGDESDFLHEWFPVSGYGFFICFMYLVVLPAPIFYYYRKETRSEQQTGKHASAIVEENGFANPLSGDVFEDDAAVGFNDDPTRANSSRVAVAKLQRSVRETRDALHAKKMENEAQQAEIQDLRDQLANSDLAVNVAAAQNKTGARYSNSAEDLAPTAPPDVLRAFVCDDALNEETREAARSVLAAQAASQIEMVAKTTARTSNIAELNDERRFTERYSSAIAAVQSSDNDMATAAAEWVKFRAWLGAERLLRHEAHMGMVLGRDVALADLKLLEQEDIDELSSEMARVEKARFKAAVQALQAVEELPHASEE